ERVLHAQLDRHEIEGALRELTPIEAHRRKIELVRERLDERILADELHVDQDLAERSAPALLLAERGAQLELVEHAGLNQDFAELLAGQSVRPSARSIPERLRHEASVRQARPSAIRRSCASRPPPCALRRAWPSRTGTRRWRRAPRPRPGAPPLPDRCLDTD